MRTKLYLIMLVLGLFLFTACSSNEKIKSLTTEQWQAVGGQKTLQILLTINKNDLQQIARISNCPEGSLTRVLKGYTVFTPIGLKKIKEIAHQVLVIKTASLDELDPAKQTWAHKSDRFLTVESRLIWWMIFIVGSLIIRVVGIGNVAPLLLLYFGFIVVFKLYIYFYHYRIDPNLLKTSFDGFWEMH